MVRHLGTLGDGVGLVLGGPPARLLAAPPPVVFLQSLLDACLLFFLFFFLLHAVGGGASRAVRAALLLGVGVGGGGDSERGLGRGGFIGGLLLRLDVDGGFGRGILDVLARGRRGRGPGRALEGHQRVERPRPGFRVVGERIGQRTAEMGDGEPSGGKNFFWRAGKE